MNKRLSLHFQLKELIGNDNVYFQPPASIQISYPCVIYSIGNGDAKRADDVLYGYINSYQITIITKKPDIELIEKMLAKFKMCSVSRTYVTENLNHYVFNLYY